MKFIGYTDGDDWNIQTLLWMLVRPRYWHAGVDWKDWRFGGVYAWYDGPMWHVFVGPLWIALAHW